MRDDAAAHAEPAPFPGNGGCSVTRPKSAQLRAWPRIAAVVALCAFAASCGGGGKARGAYAVRDSAGVQIVSNPSSVTADPACPVVDSVPAFTIGGVGAEGPYDVQLVWGALQLRDGNVVVLNGATSELRFFDGAGKHVRSVGRKGSGPGEFQSPYRLFWSGPDTLMVQDFGTSRLTMLGSDGTFFGVVPLQRVSGALLVGRLPSGEFLAQTSGSIMPGQGTSGRQRSPVHLVRLSREGAVLDTLGAFAGSENVTEISERSASVGPAMFGLNTVFALADSLVYVADGAEYRVRVYAGGRRLVRIIEKAHAPVPVTRAMWDAESARQTAASSDPRSREFWGRLHANDRMPATLPSYRNIALDGDGWLWVRPYAVTEQGSLLWDVFDASGRLRCAVRLSAALAARDVGHDRFLGVVRDEDGVEQVRVYRIRRSGRSPS